MNVYQYSIARVHAQLMEQVSKEIPGPDLLAAIDVTAQAVDRYRKEEEGES